MISDELARTLRDFGLRWHPETGDRFVIDKLGVDDDVYTVSDMTVERHEHPTGSFFGFNGTTEWALDSVAEAEALWLPREDQLRELLGPSFLGLTRVAADDGAVLHSVTARIGNTHRTFSDPDAETAYAEALAAYISVSLA